MRMPAFIKAALTSPHTCNRMQCGSYVQSGVTKTKSERHAQVAPQAVKHQLSSKQKPNPQGTAIHTQPL